ncbi:MAG: hypothetical protein Phyf2KO_10410 [Phycisphaerales bacterium]
MAELRRFLAVTLLVVLVAGCQARPTPLTDDPPEPLPTYEDVHASSQERVGSLDRFWADAAVGLRFKDADGDSRREQGEGHFQIVKPSSVALTVGKLGETYLLLGCDDDRFWWIERLDERIAYVGDQNGARDLATARVGVPVLPTDLLKLADLNAWPEPGSPEAGNVIEIERGDLDASKIFAVEFDEGDRKRVVYLTRLAHQPVGVDLVTDAGEIAARSQLLGFERVLNRIDPLNHQRVPSRILVDVPSAESRIELSLSRMEISNRRPRALVFDFDELVRRFRIDTVVPLEDIELGAGR